jgi:methionyl-tRNA formyltransferase
MPATPWRVVLITVVPAIARAYADLVRTAGHEPVAVISPRRRERGAPTIPLGAAMATEAPDGLELLFPETRRSLAPMLRMYDPDLAICTGFPWLIPQDALDVPRLGILNGHPSLLPRYRGPFPVAWAVRNGEREIGMTYHLMDAQFDTGNILSQGCVALDDDDTWESLQLKLGAAGGELLLTALERLGRGERGEPQPDGGEYQSGFGDDYLYLDPARTAAELHQQVRAWGFMPPLLATAGPLLAREGGHVRVTRSSLTEVQGAERLDCADGPLWILETQPV